MAGLNRSASSLERRAASAEAAAEGPPPSRGGDEASPAPAGRLPDSAEVDGEPAAEGRAGMDGTRWGERCRVGWGKCVGERGASCGPDRGASV